MQNPLGDALFSNFDPILGLLQQCIAVEPCGSLVAPHSCQLEAPCHGQHSENRVLNYFRPIVGHSLGQKLMNVALMPGHITPGPHKRSSQTM